MIIIPFVLNAINFWLIDNILKLKAEDQDDELKEIYSKETDENCVYNKSPIYVQIDFANNNDMHIANSDDQLEYKQLGKNQGPDTNK
jgi:hypothetical protein